MTEKEKEKLIEIFREVRLEKAKELKKFEDYNKYDELISFLRKIGLSEIPGDNEESIRTILDEARTTQKALEFIKETDMDKKLIQILSDNWCFFNVDSSGDFVSRNGVVNGILGESKTKEEALDKLKKANVDKDLIHILSLGYLDVLYMDKKDKELAVKIVKESKTKEEALDKLKKANVDKGVVIAFRVNMCLEYIDFNTPYDSLLSHIQLLVDTEMRETTVKKMKNANMDKKIINIVKYFECFSHLHFAEITEDDRIKITKILTEVETNEEAIERMKQVGLRKEILDYFIHFDFFYTFPFYNINMNRLLQVIELVEIIYEYCNTMKGKIEGMFTEKYII